MKFWALTGPPSGPRDLEVMSIDQSSVRLSWRPPADDGGRADVSYRVECVSCQNDVIYTPRQAGFNTTELVYHD